MIRQVTGTNEPQENLLTFQLIADPPRDLKGVRRRALISVDQNLFPLTFVKVSLLTSPEGERNESLILSSTSTSQLNKRYYSTQLHETVIFIGMKNFFPQVLENT